MLREFLAEHRDELVVRAQQKASRRPAPRATAVEINNGVPLFLDQLVALMRAADGEPNSDIGSSAATHGAELHERGFSIGQVVHGYGDLCQAVTQLASELDAPISTEDFKIFNCCLDDAIARAVTEYARLRDVTQGQRQAEQLGELAHELRNSLNAATLAYTVLREGRVGIGGSTGDLLGRSLRGLKDLINRSLTSVRLEVGGVHHRERIHVRDFIDEIQFEAALEAGATQIEFAVVTTLDDEEIEGDRPILAAALMNLLSNAFKFTHARGRVVLTVTATAAKVVFDVEDQCGGLPAGAVDELFRPFTQRSENRDGIGLGLSVSRKGVEANGGEIRVVDLPGRGCMFSIDLPRATQLPALAPSAT